MILEIILISLIGTFLHFTYKFSNYNKFIGIISAVNESTWEHIKIGLMATYLVSLIDYFFLNNDNYFIGKFISLLIIIIVIPIIFYGYQIILKKDNMLLDISSFYIAIIISNIMFYKVLALIPMNLEYIGIVGIVLLFILIIIFTFYPPKIKLFEDPITLNYGIDNR